MSKKFEKAINKAEMYFGDYIMEYGQSEGFDDEQVCSGEWQPSKDVIRMAMGDVLCDFGGLTGTELQKCIDYWYEQNYGE